jgi:protein arginine kinase activator
MRCQDCNKREATVSLTQIVNNEKTSLSLCKECAAARGFHSPLENAPFPLAEILSGLASKVPSSNQPQIVEDITCPNCGLTFEQFTQKGRFGCGQCYQAFRTNLEPIMRRIHGASLHRGKAPDAEPVASSGSKQKKPSISEEERLQKELQKAVETEDFERAAEIRDKLKTMRSRQTVPPEDDD